MPDYGKLFFIIFVIGIAVRIFVAIMLPDAALSDAIYHLAIARHVAENGFLPYNGIELFGVKELPQPIFHFFVASNAILLGQNVAAFAADALTFAISIIQLLVAFVLLRKLFPDKWVYGMAFFTMMPLLTKYAGVSYVETIASIFMLLSFYLFVVFQETGQKKFLLLASFSLAAMSVSKLTATILLPAFLLFFAIECRKKKIGYGFTAVFIIFSAILSGIWFIMDFLRTGMIFASNATEAAKMVSPPLLGIAFSSIQNFWWLVVELSQSFWEFPVEAVFMREDVLSIVPFMQWIPLPQFFLLLTAITMPVFLFAMFSALASVKERKPHFWLLLVLLVLSLWMLLARSTRFAHARLLLAAMPLLAISFTQGMEYLQGKWKKLFIALTIIVAAYSFLNVSLLAFYYNAAFQRSIGLYDEISELPADSKIIIAGNYARAVTWFAERDAIGPEGAFEIQKITEAAPIVRLLSKEEIYGRLKELNVTHLALVCYDDPWDRETINEMAQQEMLNKIFEQGCAVLYEVK